MNDAGSVTLEHCSSTNNTYLRQSQLNPAAATIHHAFFAALRFMFSQPRTPTYTSTHSQSIHFGTHGRPTVLVAVDSSKLSASLQLPMSSTTPTATSAAFPNIAPSAHPPPKPPKPFFTPPTAPLLDTAALDYYTSLPILHDGTVLVTHISHQRGKGLISTQAAEAGDLLFAERPVLALQHSVNRRWMRACEHCLRSIGSVREQWLRLIEERRRSRIRRQQRQQTHLNELAHDHDEDDEDEDDDDDEEEEDEDEGDEEQLVDDEKSDVPYVLPDPLPYTSQSSSPHFNIQRYDVKPVPCTQQCDEEYCSTDCRDAAWQQYHSLLCPHVSFKASGGGAGSGRKEEKAEVTLLPMADDSKLHPLQRLYKFADDNNEIFRLVTKLIATVITSHTASSSDAAPALFPFSLYAASVWWQQVSPPADLSPVSASRFQSTLQSMCAEAVTLIQAAFPTHSQSSSPFAFLFTLSMIGRLVSIFESNQLSLFAPSPVDTYIAFLLSLPPAQLQHFKQSVTPAVYRATNAVSSKRVEGVGLFTLLCCINHSCSPNCRLVKRDNEREEDGFVDLDCTMAAMATRHIDDGEELTINYVEDSESTAEGGERMTWRERAAALLDYGIVCDCERCEEEKRREEEDGDGDISEEEAELQQFEDDDNDEEEDDADAEEDDEEA